MPQVYEKDEKGYRKGTEKMLIRGLKVAFLK